MPRAVFPPRNKVHSVSDIESHLEAERKKGLRVVQCHGVFDLLHPGHIRHFKSAKAQGDLLVVSVTPDRYVNKGPGRPAFSEAFRCEALAALEDVDYVVLNDAPDAISAIRRIRPLVYVKGIEYADHAADVTGKISEEVRAVEELGGRVFYTDDIVFSSSSLINRYLDSVSPEAVQFLQTMKSEYSIEQIISSIESLKNLRVLIIGDAIIDEYQYAEPLGQTGKGHHMVAKCQDREVFLGGSLIVANHIAQYADHVTLLTAVGKECPYSSFIKTNLDAKIDREFYSLPETSTLVKKRYVLKDGQTLSKLFETYSGQEKGLSPAQTAKAIQFIQKKSKDYDLVLAADFGNGFTNAPMIHAIGQTQSFLAVNTQTNSGNRGYNIITNYERADYISINEPELRLATHDKTSHVEGLAEDIALVMQCKGISVTRGVNGVFCKAPEGCFAIPAFTAKSVDRIGAGDAYLSLSSLCLAKKLPMKLAGFLGALGASMSVQMVGNQEPIRKSALLKYLIRLMK